MRLSKFLALATATAGLIVITAAPSDAQQTRPTARDHRTTSQPAANVRDHRKAATPERKSPGIVSRELGSATKPVRGVVNTTVKTGSGAKDLVTGRPIKGAKKLVGAAAGAAVAPVSTAVNAGSKAVGGAKKVGKAAKKAAQKIGKKLNPFD